MKLEELRIKTQNSSVYHELTGGCYENCRPSNPNEKDWRGANGENLICAKGTSILMSTRLTLRISNRKKI